MISISQISLISGKEEKQSLKIFVFGPKSSDISSIKILFEETLEKIRNILRFKFYDEQNIHFYFGPIELGEDETFTFAKTSFVIGENKEIENLIYELGLRIYKILSKNYIAKKFLGEIESVFIDFKDLSLENIDI